MFAVGIDDPQADLERPRRLRALANRPEVDLLPALGPLQPPALFVLIACELPPVAPIPVQHHDLLLPVETRDAAPIRGPDTHRRAVRDSTPVKARGFHLQES